MNPTTPPHRRPIWRRWGYLLYASLLGSLIAGCCCGPCGKGSRTPDWMASNKLYHGPDNCPRLIQGSSPDPHGAFVRRFQTVQAVNAETDDFVIYRNEWYLNGDVLGPYGKYHLDQIIKRLADVPFPVLLQIDSDATLTLKRRERIVEALALAGFADADQRVIVGFPAAEGLYGEEMEQAFTRLLSGSFFGGNGFLQGYPGFGGGFGGFGGGGGFVPTLPGIGGF